jgi:hypothetical protein
MYIVLSDKERVVFRNIFVVIALLDFCLLLDVSCI